MVIESPISFTHALLNANAVPILAHGADNFTNSYQYWIIRYYRLQKCKCEYPRNVSGAQHRCLPTETAVIPACWGRVPILVLLYFSVKKRTLLQS